MPPPDGRDTRALTQTHDDSLPISSLPNAQRLSQASLHKPLKILAVPADPDDTFADLANKIEARFRKTDTGQEYNSMQCDTLRDENGGDIFPEDTISSLFRADAPSHELQLRMYLKDIEPARTEPIPSEASKKRRISEGPGVEEQGTERKKSRRDSTVGNAFMALKSSGEPSKRAGTVKNPWTEEEDRILLKGFNQGWTARKIRASLPQPTTRTEFGIRSRWRLLGRKTHGKGVSAPQSGTKPRSSPSGNFATRPLSRQAATPPPSGSSYPGGGVRSTSQGAGKKPASEQNPRPAPVRVSAPQPATEQPNVVVSPPKRRPHSGNWNDRERWAEAKERAGNHRAKARRYFAEALRQEDMLVAVTNEDTEEVDRLKAQRRRVEREYAAANGLPSPKRTAPFAGLTEMPSTVEPYDEEVVREDDWSTDSEEARNKAAGSDYEGNGMDEDEDEAAEDDTSFHSLVSSAVPDHDFGTTRIEDLGDLPRAMEPSAKSAEAKGQEEVLTAKNAALPELSRLDSNVDSNVSTTSRHSALSSSGKKTRRGKRKRGSSAVDSDAAKMRSSAVDSDAAKMPPPALPKSSGETRPPQPQRTNRPRAARVLMPEVHVRLTAEEKLQQQLAEMKRMEQLHLADDDDDDESSSSSDSDEG